MKLEEMPKPIDQWEENFKNQGGNFKIPRQIKIKAKLTRISGIQLSYL